MQVPLWSILKYVNSYWMNCREIGTDICDVKGGWVRLTLVACDSVIHYQVNISIDNSHNSQLYFSNDGMLVKR